MTVDPFAAPSSSDDKISELMGQLLLITPLEHLKNVDTVNGPRDPISADVVDLDKADEYNGMLIFQRVLVSTLKRAADYNNANPGGVPATGKPKMVLGRLDRGTPKPGKNAPWILTPPTEEDKQAARDYLAKLPVAEPADPFAM